VRHCLRLALVLAITLAAVAASAPARAQSGLDFTTISGKWSAHGIGLDIGTDGQAVASWRVYTWCSSLTQPAPCDSTIGNDIMDGGLAMLQFSSISGGTASALVLMSSDPSLFSAGSTITMQIMSGGVAQVTGTANQLTLCGPHFNPGAYAVSPCGA